MIITTIVGFSLLLQTVAAIFALRLIFITGRKKAWILLSLGIASMEVRRAITFINIFTGNAGSQPEMAYEIIGLVGSAIMLAGVLLIRPVFMSIKRAEREQKKAFDELKDATSKIKILSGLLPICASCKKVRDDKGYWEMIEVYIRDRSEAEFSHGICPECAKKLYPELDENQLQTEKDNNITGASG